jgi:hypothetical protein
MLQTNGKTNDAELTFLWHFGIPAILTFIGFEQKVQNMRINIVYISDFGGNKLTVNTNSKLTVNTKPDVRIHFVICCTCRSIIFGHIRTKVVHKINVFLP